MKRRVPFSPGEDDTLHELALNIPPGVIALRMGRTVKTIQKRMAKLGLRKVSPYEVSRVTSGTVIGLDSPVVREALKAWRRNAKAVIAGTMK